MEIIYILLIISVIANIVLSIGIRNLIKQNEELEDTLIEVVEGTRTRVETALQQMKDIDNRQVFEKDDEGCRPVFGEYAEFYQRPGNEDLLLFYEYFHGDSGKGLGASHQTGWTALIVELIERVKK